MQEYLTQMPVASIIFVFTIVTSIYTFSNPQLYGHLMLHPYGVSRGQKIYTVLTSGLIHKDWMHLLFNMMTFYFFGFRLEAILASLSSWGHLQFAIIYILALILSDVTTIIKHRDNSGYYSLGASGAICAVLFSSILFDPLMTLGIFMVIPMPAWLFGILFLFYCWWAGKQPASGINHDAHFYGAVVGILITVIFYPNILSHFINQFR